MLALFGGELLVEITRYRALRRVRALPAEELHRPLLECDGDAKQVGRIFRIALHAGKDRGSIDLEVLGRLRQIRVVALGQGLHMFLLHRGETAEELAQSRVLRIARRALVEGMAAEFDLERRADRG